MFYFSIGIQVKKLSYCGPLWPWVVPTLKRREVWRSSIFHVEIEEKVGQRDWIWNFSAPTRNQPKLGTRWKSSIFTPYIKNLGRTFLFRAHNLELSAEKWKNPTWLRMMFTNLSFWLFWSGFQLDRWKKVASYPLESMGGHNRPVMYPKCWLMRPKYKFLYPQNSEIAI